MADQKVTPYRDYEIVPNTEKGAVFVVRDPITGAQHIRKKKWIPDPKSALNAEREIRILERLDDPCIVKIYDAWTVKGDQKGDYEFVFIQMEKCDTNLVDILKLKHEAFDRMTSDRMSAIEYFLSWHILKEIAEALLYLHTPKQWPDYPKPIPVFHRDLHPANVLINYTAKFIKLCDFDQAKEFAGSKSNSRSIGAKMWMAPETSSEPKVAKTDKLAYNTKVDIYSLALVALFIFGFDITKKFKTSNGARQ